jgi:RNA polymerase sigma-70 factor (ECF subfamily)
MSSPPATRFRTLTSLVTNDDKRVREPAEPTDEMLLARVKAEDQDALGRLFERYARLSRGVAARILRDVTEAEDLVQDLFLFIRRKAGIFDRSKSTARSWIVQMAYHRAIERRRYLESRRYYTHEDIQGDAAKVSGKWMVEDDYSADVVFGRTGIQKVLGSLSENQRETIRLFFFDGYTIKEISDKLGQPVGTVRHHYYRGLEKLRKQMFDDNKKAG